MVNVISKNFLEGLGNDGYKIISSNNYVIDKDDFGKILILNSTLTPIITIPANITFTNISSLLIFSTNKSYKIRSSSNVIFQGVSSSEEFCISTREGFVILTMLSNNNYIARNVENIQDFNISITLNNFDPLLGAPWSYSSSGSADKLFTNREGILVSNVANTPRFDFDLINRRHRLLIRRVGLSQLLQSPFDWTNVVWNKNGVDVTLNSSSVMGTNYRFQKIACDNIEGVSEHSISQTIPVTGSRMSVLGRFYAPEAITHLGVVWGQPNNRVKALFDLQNGAILPFNSLTGTGLTDASVFRGKLFTVLPATASNPAVYDVELTFINSGVDPATVTFYLHNGVSHLFEGIAGQGMFVLGANATDSDGVGSSLNPSTTSATSDALSHVSMPFYGNNRGTIYCEVSSRAFFSDINIGGREIFSIGDSAAIGGIEQNRLAVLKTNDRKVQLIFTLLNSSVFSAITDNIDLTPTNIHKIAISYRPNSFILAIDGRIVGEAFTGSIPASFNTLSIGGRSTGTGLTQQAFYAFRQFPYEMSRNILEVLTA